MMIQRKVIILIFTFLNLISCAQVKSDASSIHGENTTNEAVQPSVSVGLANIPEILSLCGDLSVAAMVNQTSVINGVHLIDTLMAHAVNIQNIFAPEHGFRGNADAGELIKDGRDTKTGLPIISLYGDNKKPKLERLGETKKLEGDIETGVSQIDLFIFDLQDVGARFYTYISSLHYIMEACAQANIPLVVLDRPNPNGHYVDGPLMEMEFQSFVGMHEIPIVHGMTVGEIALMIKGEKWLDTENELDLTVVKCQNYDHNTMYELSIPPSPNLPNMKSIYLYPSLCLFEGTAVSIGRGTDLPFQIYGHPSFTNETFAFMPQPSYGAKNPKLNGELCLGENLSLRSETQLADLHLDLSFLLKAYQNYPDQDNFFTSFFTKLAGTKKLQEAIENGESEAEIKASWQEDLNRFKVTRKSYLLYDDFE